MTTNTDQPTIEVTMAVEIVMAYVTSNSLPASEVAGLITSTHAAIVALSAPPAAEPVKLEPPVPIKKTVTPDYIISLEDGKRYKSLKRHLTTRGITPDQYREKWGLLRDYPMVAESYSKARSELAKSIGLGNMRGQRVAKAVDPNAPKRPRGRPRKLGVVPAAGVVNEAA